MATTTEQFHELQNGETITIARKDGRGHTYTVDGGNPMPSATSLISHVEADGFGVGVGWATKRIRLADGDLDAPKFATDEAIAQGNALHADIEGYIKDNKVNEENPAFTSWLRSIGTHWDWLATEVFLYHPTLRYGGTLDAISWGGRDNAPIIWDWKTKDPDSYGLYGGSLKDHAQVASYAMALREMGSTYAPVSANIAYVMRDGSGVDVVEVDLEAGMALFLQSRKMKTMAADFKHLALPPAKR